MKVRSLVEYTEFLDKDFSWRRKELTNIKFSIEGARKAYKPMFLRAGIALLYAHWEGFIKNSAEAYINYVECQRLRYDELSTNFLALALKVKLNEFEETKKATVYIKLIDFIRNNLSEIAFFTKGIEDIRKKSNLNSDSLKEIIYTLGLDYKPYELKKCIIDEQLLENRNNIAHGKKIEVDETEFESIFKNIREMLDIFKTDISNAACLKSFRRNSPIRM